MNEFLALLVLGLLAGGLALLVWWPRSPQEPTAWYELGWPRDLPHGAVLAFLRALAADHAGPVITLEVVAAQGTVQHRLGVPERRAQEVLSVLRSQLPGVTAQPTERGEARTPLLAQRLAVRGDGQPLRISDPDLVSRAIVAALAGADRRDPVTYQWLLGPRVAPAEGKRPPSWGELFGEALGGKGEVKPDARLEKARREKASEAGFRCACRIAVASDLKGAARMRLSQVFAALRTTAAPGVRLSLGRERPDAVLQAQPPHHYDLELNVLELAQLLAWPLGGEPYVGVARTAARLLAPGERTPKRGRVVAEATYPGAERPLVLEPRDALQHLHVMSPTGTGKSTLLLNLAVQDIAAGRAVVVIDPKGDLVTEITKRIPEERLADVVVLDPADEERPVGLNVLAGGDRPPELIADVVLHAFHSLYKDAWGPRTQDILHAGLLTLAGRPEMSLCAVPVLLSNPRFRRRMVGEVRDEIALRPFWAWYDGLGEAERQQVIAPVMNKLRAFLLRPRMRAVLGQSSPRFDLHRVFTERKVVLASLAKGILGPEAAALLGALLIGELWQATLGRAALPAEERAPAMLYIDEFQDYLYLPTDLADVLAQARGLGLALTLAHQAAAQLPRPMLSAVLANARSRVCFQLGAEDARLIAAGTSELDAQDLRGLGRYEVYASLVSGGSVTPYVSARSLPPQPPTSDPAEVRRRSRERYGVPLAAVEAEVARLIAGDADDGEAPLGQRRRT